VAFLGELRLYRILAKQLPKTSYPRSKVEEMRRTVLVLASMTLAPLLSSGTALLNAVKPAEATFPGKNGKIAFQSDSGGSYEIYTMNRNGTEIDKLTTNRAEDEDPAFSPDGKKILFMSERDGDSDIYTMTVKGRKVVRLTSDPATTFGADWAVR
jgi:dipeptidyl aminopeptidase/acylaminoacyl peptidase